MYIDLIVLVILIILVVYFIRNFSSVVYLLCAMDILYRLLHFISENTNVPELSALIDKYIPVSLLGMFGNYVGTEGILFIIIKWIIFILYCIFLFFIVRTIVKRK